MIKNGQSVGRFAARSGYEGVEMYGTPMAAVWSSGGAGYVCTNPDSTNFTHHNNFYGTTWFDGNVDLENSLRVNGELNVYSVSLFHADIGLYGSFGATGNLYIDGGASFGKEVTATDFVKSSSRKVKENFSPITEQEALKILKLNALHFDYINGKKNLPGFIAEDVELLFKDTCSYRTSEDGEQVSLFGLDYTSFIPYLVKMIQLQQKEIDDLKMLLNSKTI